MSSFELEKSYLLLLDCHSTKFSCAKR